MSPLLDAQLLFESIILIWISNMGDSLPWIPRISIKNHFYTNYQNNHNVNRIGMTQRMCDAQKSKQNHYIVIKYKQSCVNNETNHDTPQLQDKQHKWRHRPTAVVAAAPNRQCLQDLQYSFCNCNRKLTACETSEYLLINFRDNPESNVLTVTNPLTLLQWLQSN